MSFSTEIYANVEFDEDYYEAANGTEDIYVNKDIHFHDSRTKTKDINLKRPLSTDPGTESSKRRPLSTNPGTESSKRRPLSTDPGTESSKRRLLSTNPGTESSKRRPLSTDPGTESSKRRPLSTDPGTESSKRRPLSTDPGTESSKRRPTRAAAVCLGLLCVLLLAGIIVLLVYYYTVIDSCEERIFVCKTNSSTERVQFQTRYNGMITERDQLQVERDELQAKLSVVNQHVQQGWRYYNSSWYFISTEKKTWDDSRNDCLRRGADLVIINSRKEQVFIHGLTKENVWFGLTDRVEEGKWVWVDGTTLTTGYWAGGQPNNHGGLDEDCAAYFLDGSNPEKSWHDAPCTNLLFWLCKKVF